MVFISFMQFVSTTSKFETAPSQSMLSLSSYLQLTVSPSASPAPTVHSTNITSTLYRKSLSLQTKGDKRILPSSSTFGNCQNTSTLSDIPLFFEGLNTNATREVLAFLANIRSGSTIIIAGNLTFDNLSLCNVTYNTTYHYSSPSPVPLIDTSGLDQGRILGASKNIMLYGITGGLTFLILGAFVGVWIIRRAKIKKHRAMIERSHVMPLGPSVATLPEKYSPGACNERPTDLSHLMVGRRGGE